MKENKSIYIVGIFMLITMVSIGYAILTGQLNINGSAKVKAAKWDIYFKNVKIKDGSVTASVKPSITDKTTVNFEVELAEPGDFYEFNVDVVNDGMIDAMIESISITPELTVNQRKYLSYSVTYFDDVPLEVKDILHAQKSRTLKVRVEYLKSVDNGELNSTDEILNVKATIKYVQADSTAKETTSLEKDYINLITKISGDGTHVGDELAIGDEHFYVISSDGTNITMLAKYNLNATSTYDSSMTYKQNTDTTTSSVPFSLINNWGYTDGLYVYSDNVDISQYVNNYRQYLESLGAEINEARLISYDELRSLGCRPGACQVSMLTSWVYSSSYWSGSTGFDGRIYRVINMIDRGDMNYDVFNISNQYGVRPVIIIPADAI